MSGEQSQIAAEIDARGFRIVPGALGAGVVDALIAEMDAVGAESGRRKGAGVYAIRNLLEESPGARALAQSPAVRNLAAAVLGPDCFPARAILFDKTPGANWRVIWHQDLSIAVRGRRDAPGFGPWSEKAGVIHVQPPAHVLESMLAIRLHLDDCAADNGPLRVIPGSHRAGRLSADDISQWRARSEEFVCAIPRGGALLMRPLLLHASSDAAVPGHRRVIHIEYAAAALPYGLEWFETAHSLISP